MTTETKIRKQILNLIQQIPMEQLSELDEYLRKQEEQISKKKKVLSYAGVWKDLDEDVFQELTDGLISRRENVLLQ